VHEKIREALSFIESDDRETWVRMGMAVKNELGEEGFDIWDQWSRLSGSYNQGSARAVWKSIRQGGGITSGTLFHEAKMLGWVDSGGYRVESVQEREDRIRRNKELSDRAERHRDDERQKAARRATNIIGLSKPEQHAYLDKKGFGERQGLVWWPNEKENLLVIPMRFRGEICGCQLIDREGTKKFLTGQRTRGAELVIGPAHGRAKEFWCEGYATGLSIQKCLEKVRIPVRVHVCFSAGNLSSMADDGYVIVDNDESGTGLSAAEATGLPYWQPPTPGDDFNDFHMKVGTYQASEVLKRLIFDKIRKAA
jgi:putative DNA primase/helicase